MDPNHQRWRPPATATAYTVLCVAVLVIVAALHDFGREPARPPRAAAESGPAALRRQPDVVVPCPASLNCLETAGVPRDVFTSITTAFPTLHVATTVSAYDARIPEADELQVVATTALNRYVFTLERTRDALLNGSDQRITRSPDGSVMAAALRSTWIVSVVISGATGTYPSATMSDWIQSAPLPR